MESLRTTLPVSVHSRAARRALPSSVEKFPSLNKASVSEGSRHILATQGSSGISKKKARPKTLSRKQRLRLEAGKDKAENIRGKGKVKLMSSVGREERRNKRRRKWEEIDEMIGKEVDVQGNKHRQSKKVDAIPRPSTDRGPSQEPIAQTMDLNHEEVAMDQLNATKNIPIPLSELENKILRQDPGK